MPELFNNYFKSNCNYNNNNFFFKLISVKIKSTISFKKLTTITSTITITKYLF